MTAFEQGLPGTIGEADMKIEINGLHFSAAIIAFALWAVWLPIWPSMFIFVIGQVAATYLTSVLNTITGE